MKDYLGNPLQVRGAEQYVLQNGRGGGMHFLFVRNGLGLEAWISLDRCGDISRVAFKGDNMGFFSPCGYVAPQFYDGADGAFLKCFTAGFFTTCGLTAVGQACVDEGESLPLHGTISYTPAMLCAMEETEEELTIKLRIRDAAIFSRKLALDRVYRFSYRENTFAVQDTVTNEGDAVSPHMIMYHCNMAYPLLSEDSIVCIPNNGVTPRNEHAAEHIASALQMEQPQAGYEECCYYYDAAEKDGLAHAGIYNPRIGRGVVLSYDKKELPCFTEWKMMGKTDYALGLEPGNCTPDGRDVMRKKGVLRFLEPCASAHTGVRFTFTDDKAAFDAAF